MKDIVGAGLSAVPRRSRSLREQGAERMRRAILHGDLQPGQRLLEEELAVQLEMSRGPIREALRQLEQEGLVASYPYRGTVVAETSSEEVREVLVPIRWTLEQFALEHALPVLDARDIERLEVVVKDMYDAADDSDLGRVVELDMLFHRLVVERSGQFHTLQVWDLIAPRIRGLFYRMGPHHSSLRAIGDEHRRLLDAVRTRDPVQAHAVLREHIAEPELYARLARESTDP